ncbi:MAG: leucine-rich repeat protein [Oscillospiraceae bacterium]|nr:leucine-rich repeat protein [Oscillospiraceae bacterium]
MNYKKLLSAVCAIAMVCSAALTPLSTAAVTPSVSPVATMGIEEPDTQTFEGMKYYIDDDNTVVICGYTDDIAEKLVIPEEIDGKPVIDFSQMAFYNCAKLKEVTIPATVKSFGMQTFLSCKNLEKVSLPEGLTSIYESAFAQCTSLKSITLPSTLTHLGNLVFSGCTSLEEVNAPACLTEFAEPAFSETPWLEAQIADKGYAVLNNVLLDGSGLEGEVTIPEGITTIASFAFYENKKITKVTGMDAVRCIGTGAFCECTKLTEIDLPEELYDIGTDAFGGTPFLGSHESDPIVLIGSVLYDGRNAKGDVIIPDGVKHITSMAFMHSEITSVHIPETVETIGSMAFNRCTDLLNVTFLNPDCEIPDSDYTIYNDWDENYNNYYRGVIEGYENSTAQAFAEKYGYTFKSLGEAPEKPTEATEPTEAVTEPTEAPTAPTEEPTTATEPTEAPTDPTEEPTTATEPTEAPTAPTDEPTTATEPTEKATDPTEAIDPEVTFKPVLDMFRKYVSKNWENFDGTTAEGICNSEDITAVSKCWQTKLKDKTLDEVGYEFYDGVLYISANDHATTGYDAYTFHDGKIIHLYSCTENDELKPPISLDQYSEETDVSMQTTFTLKDGLLVPDYARKCDYKADLAKRYAYTSNITVNADGTFDYHWEDPVAEEDYTRYHAYKKLKLTPLSEHAEQPTANALGDLDNDGIVNASDAAKVLIAAAAMGAGEASGLTDAQMTAADVNGDGTVNASDAAIILIYAAAVGAGDTDAKITDFVKK